MPPNASSAETALRINLPEALHPLVQLILGNPEIQAQLAAIQEPDVFEQRLCTLASEHGFELPTGLLRSLFGVDPLGMGRFRSAAIEVVDGWPGSAWIPGQSVPGDPPAFDWSWFGNSRPDAPLFADNVRKAGAYPFDRMLRSRTGLDALIAGAENAESVPLTGLVYHMSRCGSTLLARMLGAPPQHLVASEPEPLDAVIMWAETSGAPYETKLAALRAVVAALGRRRDPSWTRFFIKLDGWHILSHRLLRDAFPEVPWVFLHRDPVEVMVSLANMPGLQSVAGMLPSALLGIADPFAMHPDDYGAAVLGRFCAVALEAHHAGGGMIIDYPDLIPAALDAIPRHFGVLPDAEIRATMVAASAVNAKDPATKFVADSAEKQAGAEAQLRERARVYLADLRARLLAVSRA